MKVLVDGKVEKFSHGYLLGTLNGRTDVRFSFHSTVEEHKHRTEENFKVVSGGSVYVLNYNKDTYKSESPDTFEEWTKWYKNK